MIDKDAIIAMAIDGKSVPSIARHLGCSQAVVRDALDEYSGSLLKPAARTAMLALEVSRIEDLTM